MPLALRMSAFDGVSGNVHESEIKACTKGSVLEDKGQYGFFVGIRNSVIGFRYTWNLFLFSKSNPGSERRSGVTWFILGSDSLYVMGSQFFRALVKLDLPWKCLATILVWCDSWVAYDPPYMDRYFAEGARSRKQIIIFCRKSTQGQSQADISRNRTCEPNRRESEGLNCCWGSMPTRYLAKWYVKVLEAFTKAPTIVTVHHYFTSFIFARN